MARRATASALTVLFLVLLFGCGRPPLHRPAPEPSPGPIEEVGNGNRVVILVIDGLRYSESFGDPAAAHIPRLAGKLRPQGALFERFRNEGQTSTNPGHASLLTGTWQDIANDGSQRPYAPTLFEYFRARYSAPVDRVWVVAGKTKLDILAYSTDGHYGESYGATEYVGQWNDATVVNNVLSVLERAHPVLLLANLPSVDGAGHSGDWNQYLAAIETADSLVYEVWTALQRDSFYAGKTCLFVTDDHGRHDDTHGGFQDHGCGCEGCRHIMLLVAGPKIVPGLTVSEPHTLRDICATAGEILGCPTPKSQGAAIREMFAGELTPAQTP